jgi:hypothetical protein
LFEEFDAQAAVLGISSFGCSVASLEEVFLNVTATSYTDDGDASVSSQPLVLSSTPSTPRKSPVPVKGKFAFPAKRSKLRKNVIRETDSREGSELGELDGTHSDSGAEGSHGDDDDNDDNDDESESENLNFFRPRLPVKQESMASSFEYVSFSSSSHLKHGSPSIATLSVHGLRSPMDSSFTSSKMLSNTTATAPSNVHVSGGNKGGAAKPPFSIQDEFTGAGDSTSIFGESTPLLMPINHGPGVLIRKRGFALWRQRFVVLLRKRARLAARSKLALGAQLLPPLIFTLLALLVVQTLPTNSDAPPRSLSNLPASYGDNTLWYTGAFPNGTSSNISLSLADTVLHFYESLAGETVQLIPSLAEMRADGGFQYNTTSEFLVTAAGDSTADVAYFNRNNMVALTFHPTTQPATVAGVEIMAWFNGQGYHSVAEALASVHAVVLSNTAPNVKLDFVNHPLPRSQQEQARDLVDDITGFVVSFCVLFGMAPLAASFTILFVNERRSKAKLLQYISGASPLTYWLSAFTWDFVNYLIPCMGCWALFAIFDVDAFSEGINCGTVVLLFVSYGIAIIPLMYLFSLLFFDASAAFTRGLYFF